MTQRGLNSNANSISVGTMWISLGTMFDPLNISDKSWLTPRPNAQIGNAVAMINSQMTNYEQSGNDYYLTTSGMDKFTQSSDRVMQFSIDNGSPIVSYANVLFAGNYSNANPIESSSY
jgi:hypothetical protein